MLSALLLVTLLLPAVLSTSVRPLVLWHGLGDSHSSPGMLEFVSMVEHVHPGIFIHSIRIEEDLDADQRAGFYGNVNEQIDIAADQLASIPELQAGFDAIGFSQGGQFLRAYVERYNNPPVNNLITFGSQHMGVSDLPLCRPYDLMCKVIRRAVKGGMVYGEWAQEHLVQAQYFRDPSQLQAYLTSNHFLTSINNELPESSQLKRHRNTTYAENLSSLSTLVLVLFSEDKTVIPKESAWFGSESPPDDQEQFINSPHQTPLTPSFPHPNINTRPMIPLHAHPLYTQDWIGIRRLDERGGLLFDICEGAHMQIGGCWERLVRTFCGEEVD